MPALFTKEIKNKNEKYIDLDGAGIIYPYVATKNWNSTYRLEARLRVNVNPIHLEAAAKVMKEKYPYFFSRLSTHGKKYVLKRGYIGSVVCRNTEFLKPFDFENDETLIRIIYDRNILAIEFFHGICDGHGAQMFFNELLKEYCSIAFSQYGYDNQKESRLAESEVLQQTNDIYDEIYSLGGKGVNRFCGKAYQFDEKRQCSLSANSINIFSSALKTAAHKYAASVSEYLCAVQIASILKTENVKRKTIRISIPADIRRFFDSTTPRNASLYFLVEIKPHKIKDFNALINTVKKQFDEQLTKEKMQNLAYSNVKCAKMKAYNALPIALKKIALNIGYTTFGENQFTSTLTNLGVFKIDESVKGIVSSAYFVLGKEKTKPLNLAVTTYGSETKIVVSSTIESARFIHTMCEILLADGISSSVTSLNSRETIINSFDKAS